MILYLGVYKIKKAKVLLTSVQECFAQSQCKHSDYNLDFAPLMECKTEQWVWPTFLISQYKANEETKLCSNCSDSILSI